jgi:replicative DNA helicase
VTVRPDLLDEQPQSRDAERAVLGAVLNQSAAWYRLGDLTADDFCRDSNDVIFAAMALMVEERIEIDALTLAHELRKRGQLELVGGMAYIASLLNSAPDVANVETYAAIVVRMAKKRAQIKLGNQLMRDGADLETEPEDVAAAAIAALSPQATREDAQARPLAEVLSETYDAMQALRERNLGVAMTCGWSELDEMKVFTPTFAVTGAPTKHGKSAWMVALANGLARNGYPTAIISLESSKRELALRHTASFTQIPHSRVRDWRTFSDADYAKVASCRSATSRLPIYLTRGLRTAEDIALELRRMKSVYGIRAAFIDYIQLVDLKRKVDNREERLAEVAKLFLETAIEYEVHVNALSQLRDEAGKDGARLSVSDLAYAKAIGKSARIVGLFQRPGKANHNGGRKECEVDWQIEANNEDRTNDFTAHFDEVTQTFAEGTCEQNDCRSLRVAQRALL